MQATQQKFRGCLLVGAMAGAYHGESCLPKKWLHIENKDYIIQMADELYAMEQQICCIEGVIPANAGIHNMKLTPKCLDP